MFTVLTLARHFLETLKLSCLSPQLCIDAIQSRSVANSPFSEEKGWTLMFRSSVRVQILQNVWFGFKYESLYRRLAQIRYAQYRIDVANLITTRELACHLYYLGSLS